MARGGEVRREHERARATWSADRLLSHARSVRVFGKNLALKRCCGGAESVLQLRLKSRRRQVVEEGARRRSTNSQCVCGRPSLRKYDSTRVSLEENLAAARQIERNGKTTLRAPASSSLAAIQASRCQRANDASSTGRIRYIHDGRRSLGCCLGRAGATVVLRLAPFIGAILVE